MVEYTKFVLGLAQFNDWLFAFFPSFLDFCGLLRRGGARQGDTPLSRRSFREQETVLRYNNPLKPKIFGLDHVLQSCERFLNRIVPEDLVSSSDLEVTFVHKNLHLKNGFSIRPVDQVKMAFEGVRICKRENAPPLATTQMPVTTTSSINPLLLKCPTWHPLLSRAG